MLAPSDQDVSDLAFDTFLLYEPGLSGANHP